MGSWLAQPHLTGEMAAAGSAFVYALGRQQPRASPRAQGGGALSRQVLWGRDRLSHESVQGCHPQGCLHRTTLAPREE